MHSCHLTIPQPLLDVVAEFTDSVFALRPALLPALPLVNSPRGGGVTFAAHANFKLRQCQQDDVAVSEVSCQGTTATIQLHDISLLQILKQQDNDDVGGDTGSCGRHEMIHCYHVDCGSHEHNHDDDDAKFVVQNYIAPLIEPRSNFVVPRNSTKKACAVVRCFYHVASGDPATAPGATPAAGPRFGFVHLLPSASLSCDKYGSSGDKANDASLSPAIVHQLAQSLKSWCSEVEAALKAKRRFAPILKTKWNWIEHVRDLQKYCCSSSSSSSSGSGGADLSINNDHDQHEQQLSRQLRFKKKKSATASSPDRAVVVTTKLTVPLGTGCSSTVACRAADMRTDGLPFDWILTSLQSNVDVIAALMREKNVMMTTRVDSASNNEGGNRSNNNNINTSDHFRLPFDNMDASTAGSSRGRVVGVVHVPNTNRYVSSTHVQQKKEKTSDGEQQQQQQRKPPTHFYDVDSGIVASITEAQRFRRRCERLANVFHDRVFAFDNDEDDDVDGDDDDDGRKVAASRTAGGCAGGSSSRHVDCCFVFIGRPHSEAEMLIVDDAPADPKLRSKIMEMMSNDEADAQQKDDDDETTAVEKLTRAAQTLADAAAAAAAAALAATRSSKNKSKSGTKATTTNTNKTLTFFFFAFNEGPSDFTKIITAHHQHHTGSPSCSDDGDGHDADGVVHSTDVTVRVIVTHQFVGYADSSASWDSIGHIVGRVLPKFRVAAQNGDGGGWLE